MIIRILKERRKLLKLSQQAQTVTEIVFRFVFLLFTIQSKMLLTKNYMQCFMGVVNDKSEIQVHNNHDQ